MISIIIPTFDQNDMTNDCIQAVMETSHDYEIIVIDNGSTPEYKPPFTGFNECRIIRNDENKGFPAAVNQGIEAARGEDIVLLNNDVTVTPGAINRMAGWLNAFDIVGPITNYAGGTQRVQIASYQSIDELNEEAEALAEAGEGESEEVNWIIGFCMAFKKSLADDVGSFDESLWPCSGEEIDFCLRAKEKGYTVGIVYDTYVHHEGSVTFRDMEDEGHLKYLEVCARNEAHLKERWGFDVWNRQSIEAPPEAIPVTGITLNLGCGVKRSHLEGAVNIDSRPEVEPDLICDITKGLPYEDDSVDMIYALDFIEHLERPEVVELMDEIFRVLKPGGRFHHRTPSDDGRGAWQDPTHRSAWNINTWRFYFVEPEYRDLYGTKAHFKIIDLHDEITDQENKIVHTHCTYEVVKQSPKDPKIIVAELVDGCGLRCALCWNRNRKGSMKQMSLETVGKILDKYNDPVHRIAWYNWGEPFLHNDFETFAEMVGESNAQNMMSSSLSLPITDSRLESLRHFDSINISLSGMTPEIYNIYHINGNFDLVMKNLKRLSELGLSGVSMTWLSHKHNAFQLPLAKEFANSLGFKFFVEQHLNCEVEDLVNGFDHELLKDPKYPNDGDACHIGGWDVIDVDGNYLLCCASHNVKIGYTIDDIEGENMLSDAKLNNPLCMDCREKECWRMF